MNTDNQKPQSSSDEIDLNKMFTMVGQGFYKGWMGFMRFLALIRKTPLENKGSFLTIIAVTIAIGVGYSLFLNKKYYETTMVLSSNYLNKRLVESMVEKLNLLAREQHSRGLARVLNLSDTLADNIVHFDAVPFVAEADVIELEVLKEQLRNAQLNSKNEQVIDAVIKRIEIENRHAYQITVRTLNPNVIPNLQQAIVSYFRNNEYIKKRIEINQRGLEVKKINLTREIEKLDSLKSVIYSNYKSMAEQSRQGSNNVILTDKAVTNPIDVYRESVYMYNQLELVVKELYLNPDFEIVDGFTEFSDPSSTSTPKLILYSILVGLIIAYIDVALRAFNKYLAKLD